MKLNLFVCLTLIRIFSPPHTLSDQFRSPAENIIPKNPISSIWPFPLQLTRSFHRYVYFNAHKTTKREPLTAWISCEWKEKRKRRSDKRFAFPIPNSRLIHSLHTCDDPSCYARLNRILPVVNCNIFLFDSLTRRWHFFPLSPRACTYCICSNCIHVVLFGA